MKTPPKTINDTNLKPKETKSRKKLVSSQAKSKSNKLKSNDKNSSANKNIYAR
jgi:hypothetical protein